MSAAYCYRSGLGTGIRALILASVFTPLFAAANPSGSPLAAQELTINAAVYSSEQAKDGRKLFRKHCKTCHQEDYFDTVMQVWNGETLHELFSVMAATMPQSNPGSLRDQEYLDVLAYVLSSLGYPSGSEALESSHLTTTRIALLP